MGLRERKINFGWREIGAVALQQFLRIFGAFCKGNTVPLWKQLPQGWKNCRKFQKCEFDSVVECLLCKGGVAADGGRGGAGDKRCGYPFVACNSLVNVTVSRHA